MVLERAYMPLVVGNDGIDLPAIRVRQAGGQAQEKEFEVFQAPAGTGEGALPYI